MSEQREDDVLARILDDPEVQAAGVDGDREVASAPSPDGMQGLGALLSPDLLASLPAMLGALSPAPGGKGEGKRDDRTVLLSALKPYMSPKRCEAIDKLIMFGRIGDVLGRLKGG